MTILYFVIGVLLTAVITTVVMESKPKKNSLFIQDDFDIPEMKCKRCSHTWTPRKETIKVCPKCKSKYWNKDYTRKVTKKQLKERENNEF